MSLDEKKKRKKKLHLGIQVEYSGGGIRSSLCNSCLRSIYTSIRVVGCELIRQNSYMLHGITELLKATFNLLHYSCFSLNF